MRVEPDGIQATSKMGTEREHWFLRSTVLSAIDEEIASAVDLATLAHSYGDVRTREDARECLGALRTLRDRFEGGPDE